MFRLCRFRRTRQRRLISAVVALYVLFGSLPLQLSIGPTKDFSKPFPCQHRACGCRSAEQCSRSCCCFSPAQKLAWERLNSKASGATEQPVSRSQFESRLCCQKKSSDAPDVAASCSGDDSPRCSQAGLPDPATSITTKGLKRVQLVVAGEARRCGGLSALWMTLGDICPPEPPQALASDVLPGGRIEVGSESLPSSISPPPVPPPRIGPISAVRAGA